MYLKDTDFSVVECGRYEIEGLDVYVVVFNYETKSPQSAVKEAHKRYIDIQYVAKGQEWMGYAGILSMNQIGEYADKEDYACFEGKMDYFHVDSGTFIVFGPDDVHSPGNTLAEPENVKKIVVKVKI